VIGRLGAALLLTVTLGCADAPPAPLADDAALDLPGCGTPPSPDPDPPPVGAVIPPGTRVTAFRQQDGLGQLNGYVTSTPRQVRAWIAEQPGLEVVAAQDDGYEAQLLVSDGSRRTFVKVRAVCTQGSRLVEIIAPADAAEALPTPNLEGS
jgi:hypothetical protein